ncbi:NAD(P)-dependent oxidoreductase [Streptomyces sp. NPDC058656]|uniref:NAD(P)-dependent oxidoreductase n=1 Tax=unclassified Streptomyces TaxID=2593676 RepID=UPI00366A11B6
MRFLLLGATGATGGVFTDCATAAGHEVVAFVRDPAKLAPRERVTAAAGDVRDADALAQAMRGVNAVVSTLGIGKSKDPANLITDSTRALVQAAEASGTKRVVIMSAFGVGESLAKASGVLRFLYKGGRATFADKAAGERILTDSALEWTLVYPVLLTNKPATAVQAIDLKQLDRLPGIPRISRADVAEFLLSAAVEGTWSRRTAVLTK